MKFRFKGHTLHIEKVICLLLYKCFAQWLPVSYRYYPIGRIAKWIRYQLCSVIFEECGIDNNIEHRANFGTGFHIRMGSHSSIGIHSKIPNNLIIGDNIMMGPRCQILTQNHVYERVDIPKWQQGMSTPPQCIEIQSDAWIGQEVLILPGKTISEGCVIAARTVVNKTYPKYCVVGGNPSRIIKYYDFETNKWEKVKR